MKIIFEYNDDIISTVIDKVILHKSIDTITFMDKFRKLYKITFQQFNEAKEVFSIINNENCLDLTKDNIYSYAIEKLQ